MCGYTPTFVKPVFVRVVKCQWLLNHGTSVHCCDEVLDLFVSFNCTLCYNLAIIRLIPSGFRPRECHSDLIHLCVFLSGVGADLYTGVGCSVWGGRPKLCAKLHPGQRAPGAQGHSALGHGRGLAPLQQDGAPGLIPGDLRGVVVQPP